MFDIERAAAYAARYGIPREALETALRAGELPSSGTMPRGVGRLILGSLKPGAQLNNGRYWQSAESRVISRR